MAIAWTITGGSHTNASFASLGLSQLRRELLNQGADRCTFVQDGAAFDGTPLFAYGATVTIKRDGVKWFVGTVERVPRAGRGRSESLSYEIAGPWLQLEKTVFQQKWKVPDVVSDPDTTLSDEYRSSVILNLKEDGTTLTTRQQIKEAFDYLLMTGASLAITDTDFPALTVTWEEGKDMTCAEVIRRQLRWTPDACLWWDYSATVPTLHCARRAAATEVEFAVDGSEPKVQAVELTELPELQVPVVVLRYEAVNQQDDISWSTTTTDKYPVASSMFQVGAVVMTIPLSGSSINYQRQKVKTRNIAHTSDAWWKKHLTWLNDAAISGITITSAAKKNLAGGALDGSYVNELFDGAVPNWLAAYAQPARVDALISYTYTDSSTSAVSKVNRKPISTSFIATTSRIQSSSEFSWKEYKQVVAWTVGETPPTGLAQALYDALSVLQYEGQLVLTEADVASNVRPGHVLNLTGGPTAWATMKAQIQAVSEDVDLGTTSIRVGPAQHLGPADMLELLRPNRSRTPASSMATRTTGVARSNAVTDGPTSSANNSPSGGDGPFSRLTLVDPSNNAKKITIDAELGKIEVTDGSKTISLLLADLASAETVACRATQFCDTTTKTARFLRGIGA